MPRAVKRDPSEPLADARRERFARLRAIGVPVIEAASRAGFRTAAGYDILPGNAWREARREDVRARVAFLVGDEAAIVAETRTLIRQRLMAVVTFDPLKDFVRLDEAGGVTGIDWAKLRASDSSIAVDSFKFDRETGRLVEFTRDSALQAIAQLRAMYGLQAPARVSAELSGPGGKPIELEARAVGEIEAARRSAVVLGEALAGAFDPRPSDTAEEAASKRAMLDAAAELALAIREAAQLAGVAGTAPPAAEDAE